MNISAFGVLPYFMDPWHYLDAVVVASSTLELIIAILASLQGLIAGLTINLNVKGDKRIYE